MGVIIYTLPNCAQCDQTKRSFKRAGIDFSEYDISANPDVERKVKEMGYASAPVVVFNDTSWSGFRPDHINNTIDIINKNKLKNKA